MSEYDAWGPDWEEFRVREMKKRIRREKLRNAQAKLQNVARKIAETLPPRPDLDVQDGHSKTARDLGIRSYRGRSYTISVNERLISRNVRLPYVQYQHGPENAIES